MIPSARCTPAEPAVSSDVESPTWVTSHQAGLPGLAVDEAAEWSLQPGELRSFTLRLSVPADTPAQAGSGAQPIRLQLTPVGGTEVVLSEGSTFLLPR